MYLRMIGAILAGIATIYGLFVLFMYLFQERFIYFPVRMWVGAPTEVGLAYEDVWLTTADGVKLSAWYIPATDARGTILYLHGNAGNISHRLGFIRILHDLGLNTLMIDYRGYGQSEGGPPSETGTYLDAEAAWHYLRQERNTPATEIIIWGSSLGGGIASWLAEKHPPQALILLSTFTSAVDMGRQQYPFLPVRWMARVHYDNLSRMPHLTCPVLIIHSPDDEIIPYSQAERLFAAAPEPKTFIKTHGGHNSFWINKPSYRHQLNQFITQSLGKPLTP